MAFSKHDATKTPTRDLEITFSLATGVFKGIPNLYGCIMLY